MKWTLRDPVFFNQASNFALLTVRRDRSRRASRDRVTVVTTRPAEHTKIIIGRSTAGLCRGLEDRKHAALSFPAVPGHPSPKRSGPADQLEFSAAHYPVLGYLRPIRQAFGHSYGLHAAAVRGDGGLPILPPATKPAEFADQSPDCRVYVAAARRIALGRGAAEATWRKRGQR